MEIPKKFQNDDGTLNADSIIKSYSELEKKIGGMVTVPMENSEPEVREKFLRAAGVPDDISEYPANPLFDDDAIREKFKSAGLNKAQVEKIYEIANEYLQPALADIFAKRYEEEAIGELKNFFGGEDKMRAAISDIAAFGEKFLPADTFQSLSASPAGIRSIYAMMQSMEPSVETGKSAADAASESDLREMMKDPKYWRDHDAEYIRKIETGFKKLYA